MGTLPNGIRIRTSRQSKPCFRPAGKGSGALQIGILTPTGLNLMPLGTLPNGIRLRVFGPFSSRWSPTQPGRKDAPRLFGGWSACFRDGPQGLILMPLCHYWGRFPYYFEIPRSQIPRFPSTRGPWREISSARRA
jgi:hypothetical protein